jgi:hypothetical protein
VTAPSDWTIIIPLVSALAGAGVGAYSAQYIAARNKRHDDLLKEVRSANAACTMAYSITDSFITVKRDIVKPLLDNFTKELARFEVAGRNFIPGVSAPIDIAFDLQTFTLVKTPVSHLQDIVYKGVSAPIRAISIMSVLDRTIAGLEGFHAERNKLCDELRQKPFDGHVYFGVKKGDATDARYSSVLSNLSSYSDDAIYFSRLLGDDLKKYANEVKARLPKKLQVWAPVITSASFAKAADILPDPAKYNDYEIMFQSVRVLGRGIWTARFEALAYAQYETELIPTAR